MLSLWWSIQSKIKLLASTVPGEDSLLGSQMAPFLLVFTWKRDRKGKGKREKQSGLFL